MRLLISRICQLQFGECTVRRYTTKNTLLWLQRHPSYLHAMLRLFWLLHLKGFFFLFLIKVCIVTQNVAFKKWLIFSHYMSRADHSDTADTVELFQFLLHNVSLIHFSRYLKHTSKWTSMITAVQQFALLLITSEELYEIHLGVLLGKQCWYYAALVGATKQSKQ